MSSFGFHPPVGTVKFTGAEPLIPEAYIPTGNAIGSTPS